MFDNCQRYAHNYYPYFLRHNDKKVMLGGNEGKKTEQYGPDLIQEQTLEFIESNEDKPFFLFVPHVIPHAELLVPDDDIVRSYRGKFPEKPYKGADDGPNYKIGGYGSVETPHANFAAMVTRLDRHVGEILGKLHELGLDKNTLVIFTSDNGPHSEGGAKPSYFNSSGGLRGMKRDPNGPLELYDLEADPQEKNNVASQQPDIVEKMERVMKEAHTDSDVFLFGQSQYRGDRLEE